MTFHKPLLSAGLVLLVSTSCGTRDEPEPAPSLQLEPCRLKGYDQEISCARFEVFEDRKARTGRKILLNIAVIQAASGNPAPDPLFILAGGPGQAATSYVHGFDPSSRRFTSTATSCSWISVALGSPIH